MGEQKPSIGRIVHYVSYGTPKGEFKQQCRAAVITDLTYTDSAGSGVDPGESDIVGLCVLNPTGIFFHDSVYSNDTQKGGSWHWPEPV